MVKAILDPTQLTPAMKRQMEEALNKYNVKVKAQKIQGSSGAGMVKFSAGGNGIINKCEIDPRALELGKEFVEDMIIHAFNDFHNNSTRLIKEAQEEYYRDLENIMADYLQNDPALAFADTPINTKLN